MNEGGRRPAAVFDSGPLIYLDALGYLPALEWLYRVIIPDAVAGELARRPRAPGSGAPALSFVERLTPEPEDVRRVASTPPSIGAGEREVIALAEELEAIAVVDDGCGRRRVRQAGVPLTGTLGVLAAIQHAGRGLRSFEEDLDALDEAGMYLTEELKRRVAADFHQRGDG